MRGKIQLHSKEQKMQKLLDRECELEAELQRCQDNIDIFEQYYLQNSWRTGNIFLGWPICTYAEITEFINRPRAKKNIKPYVEISDHQKIFSLSSVSSRPFINVSKVTYLATKDLHLEGRQRIPRSGNQSKKNKVSNERLQKMDISSNQNVLNYKEEEARSEVDNSEAEDDCRSDSEESVSQNQVSQRGLKGEPSQEEESENQSLSQNGQSNQSRERLKSEEDSERIKQEKYEFTCQKPKDQEKNPIKAKKSVIFFHNNEKRIITLESSSDDN